MEQKEEVVESTTKETKPLSFDEMINSNKEYQSAFDKKVASALENQKSKIIADYEAKIEAEKTEAEKLANMKEAEKHKYELDKINKEKDDAIAELNAFKLEKEAQKIAMEKGLDISLLSDIDYKKHTAETISAIIDTKKEVFDKALEKAINEKLKQNTPKQYESGKTDNEDPLIKGFKSVY